MPYPVYIPRLNNNDDEVRLTSLLVSIGAAVEPGQALAEVETDKANFVVEAERSGYVLAFPVEAGATVAVGSVLLWLGEEPTEQPPVPDVGEPEGNAVQTSPVAPLATLKARLMMAEHALDASQVPFTGERIGVEDVEAFLAARPAGRSLPPTNAAAPSPAAILPIASGQLVKLSAVDRGMLRFVQWHRDEAAAAYLELEYDPQPWEDYAARYAESHRLLSNPLVPLMLHQMARIAAGNPRLNSTIVNGGRFAYDQVNLGFTIQVQETLYLTVVRDAAALSVEELLKAYNRLHKRAMGHKLTADELDGATVGFSSMARWPVRRHIPILPPFVSLMCAHSLPPDGPGVLGATYDHRVLSGGDTYAILSQLTQPLGK